ncbi:MAG: Energy-coupling factor transporter transmembrane protein EcfT [Firmicutes bacterium ADurb.Bin193]|nr:MAG: Energy-coupling factor transporter transmembrane protein EcfT [Firmicutes bacterium ADurb.Bin193]
MKSLLTYVNGESFFHRLHPLTKLAWAVAACVACFASGSLPFVAAMVILCILIAVFGGIFSEALSVLKFFGVVAAILFVLQIVFVRSGIVVISLGGFSVTDEGLLAAFFVSLRTVGSLAPLSLMIMFTPTTALSAALTDNLRVPYKYTFIVTAALRFIPTFTDEMDHIVQAQISRGHAIDGKNPVKRFFGILPMSIPLLVSSVRRIDQMAISLETRGFGLGVRSTYKKQSFKAGDFIALAFVALILVLGIAL